MAYPLNSKEFAEAWRIISESLLATVQGLDVSNMSALIEREVPTKVNAGRSSYVDEEAISGNNTESAQVKVEEPTKVKEDTVYANCPVPDGKGGYKFKNLKEESTDSSMFEIDRFTDGSAVFSIIKNLGPEARQLLKDNLSTLLPAKVGVSEGSITDVCQILNVMEGKGEIDGRSVKILSPLKVIFQ